MGVSLHLAYHVSKVLARIRLTPLKETGHKVGDKASPQERTADSERQGVVMKFGARPQSFNRARSFEVPVLYQTLYHVL